MLLSKFLLDCAAVKALTNSRDQSRVKGQGEKALGKVRLQGIITDFLI